MDIDTLEGKLEVEPGSKEDMARIALKRAILDINSWRVAEDRDCEWPGQWHVTPFPQRQHLQMGCSIEAGWDVRVTPRMEGLSEDAIVSARLTVDQAIQMYRTLHHALNQTAFPIGSHPDDTVELVLMLRGDVRGLDHPQQAVAQCTPHRMPFSSSYDNFARRSRAHFGGSGTPDLPLFRLET